MNMFLVAVLRLNAVISNSNSLLVITAICNRACNAREHVVILSSYPSSGDIIL
jgi:hypothetical protein